jgi:hypothetical protein
MSFKRRALTINAQRRSSSGRRNDLIGIFAAIYVGPTILIGVVVCRLEEGILPS